MDLTNDNIIHKKEGDIEYIEFKRLLEYQDKVRAIYTLKGPNDLNYNRGNEENYKNICELTGMKYDNLVEIAKQVHSEFIDRVDDTIDIHTLIDGLVTDKKDIPIVTRSADCTSIFMYDPLKNVIANIHSGWRGTLKRISYLAVQRLEEEYNVNPQDLICCLCPNIGADHFEVDFEVKNMFIEEFKDTDRLDDIVKLGREEVLAVDDIYVRKNQKYLINTNLINRTLLQYAGVRNENIIESGICTMCNKEDLHSYRVEKNDMRNAAIISLI